MAFREHGFPFAERDFACSGEEVGAGHREKDRDPMESTHYTRVFATAGAKVLVDQPLETWPTVASTAVGRGVGGRMELNHSGFSLRLTIVIDWRFVIAIESYLLARLLLK